MSRDVVFSIPKIKRELLSNNRASTIMNDLKLLFKAPVLIANVLPVFTGYWLALYFNNLAFIDYINVFVLLMTGSTMVMAGALLLNNWYDADIDKVMDRTKNRPTVTGNISLHVVLLAGIVLTLVGLILLLFTSFSAAIYAFIGWFTYVLLYTMWSKRRYTFNTIIGSVSGAVTPLIGWAAVQPDMTLIPIMLFLLLFIWQMPHTYAIAIKKVHEYKAAGVAMLPVVRGIDVTKRHTLGYIICLIPMPYLMIALGPIFIVVATFLNVCWLGLSIRGFYTKNDHKWAHQNFIFSVNYLTILFLLMIFVTLPWFN
jgi:heme o synthase